MTAGGFGPFTVNNPNDMVCGDPGSSNYPCVFDCGATLGASCSDKRIICPAGSPRCDVICHGASACASTEIVCGDGECNVTCEMGACSAQTVIRCSKGPCKLTCNAPADFVKPTIENAEQSCKPDFAGCQ